MLRRLRGLNSIQLKMVVALFLLALVAMQLVSTFLLRELEGYYLGQEHQNLETTAGMYASVVLNDLAQDTPNVDTVRDLVQAYAGPPGSSARTDSRMVVVNSEDVVLGSSSIDVQPNERFPAPEVTNSALLGQAKTGSYADPDGRRHYTVAVPVARRGHIYGAVYVDASLEGVYATLADVRRILLEATVLAAAFLVLLGFLLARTITGPIFELTRRAGELAAGNFDTQIQVRSGDEIGRLAGTFNHLSRQLKETLAEISSEKQRAEAILTYMADGILTIDRDGRVSLINPAASRMLRVRAADALERPLADILPAAGVAAALDEGLKGEGLSVQAELEAPHRSLQAHLAPLRGQDGESARVVMVLRDITEQEQVEALRKEFVANVSHELKTPITTIKSYVETLMDGALKEPRTAANFLGVIGAEVDRMTRMINDLLQLSRMDHDRGMWDRRPLDVAALADDVCAKLRRRTSLKHLDLRTEAQAGLRPALADRDKIEQLLTNLVTNSIDFTPEGGHITVSTHAAGGDLVVAVRDTGVGIPAEDLPRIFERFYRVDKARSREFGGTGLGLSIAKEIVEGHGGVIRIESEPGQGTEVRFTLPLVGEGYRRRAAGAP